MEIIKTISVNDINEIVDAIVFRQDKFDEDLRTSVAVVILNYGDKEVGVQCTKGEWHGTKGNLPKIDSNSIPTCPQGHPLFETSVAPRLGLIKLDA